jgi:hypothetical protein
MSIVPGYILQLALLGTEAVAGAPDAVRALWPNGTSGDTAQNARETTT